MKTMAEIIEEHQRKAGAILSGYQDKIQKLTDKRMLDDPFASKLSSEEHFRLLQTEKQEAASAAHAETVEAYRKEIERYHTEAATRRLELEASLFGLVDSDTASGQAAMADDAALARMLEHAARANNFTLAKAAFVEAHLRGLGDVIGRYFDEVDDEARELYQELQEVPSDEMLERQVQSVELIIQRPSPEHLAGTPRVGA